MEKITANIKDMIMVNEALIKLLNCQGIDYRKTYWFDRNLQHVQTHVKAWFTKNQVDIFNKYAVDVPANGFIPPTKYEEFKKELSGLIADHSFERDLNELLAKYEVKVNMPKSIPVERSKEYQEEITKEAESFNKEIEYQIIKVDKALRESLKNLSGQEQLAIGFMLEEESELVVFPGSAIK
jgi:hypothetical protein